jgi:hypothetical protein
MLVAPISHNQKLIYGSSDSRSWSLKQQKKAQIFINPHNTTNGFCKNLPDGGNGGAGGGGGFGTSWYGSKGNGGGSGGFTATISGSGGRGGAGGGHSETGIASELSIPYQ